jgi:hypothetical protein
VSEETKERDLLREMAVAQGWVPKDCTLPGPIVMATTNTDGDACSGCNMDRSVCHGRPKKETYGGLMGRRSDGYS